MVELRDVYDTVPALIHIGKRKFAKRGNLKATNMF